MSEKEFVESNQEFVVNFLFGLIIWLWGTAVFLPISVEYGLDWYSVFAVIHLVVIVYYWGLSRRRSGPLFAYLSNKLTSVYMSWRGIDEDKRPEIWRNIQKLFSVCVLLVVYLMLRPLLLAVSVVLPGIALILVLLQILIYVIIPIKPIKLNFLNK